MAVNECVHTTGHPSKFDRVERLTSQGLREKGAACTHQVHWSTSTNAGGEFAFLQVASYSTHRKLQTSLAGSADLFLACGLALAASRHCCVCSRRWRVKL